MPTVSLFASAVHTSQPGSPAPTSGASHATSTSLAAILDRGDGHAIFPPTIHRLTLGSCRAPFSRDPRLRTVWGSRRHKLYLRHRIRRRRHPLAQIEGTVTGWPSCIGVGGSG